MPNVILPSPLAARAGGADRLALDGTTTGETLRALEAAQPGLKGWFLDDRGELREHVALFVNGERADLERELGDGDELHVVQAISGGAPEVESRERGRSGEGEAEVLIGTKKGLVVLRGARGGPMTVAHRAFPGNVCEYAMREPRSGTYLASITHGHFGPRVFWADDPGGEWEQAEGLAFPEEAGASVKRIWIVKPGEGDGVLWAGVAPAALFKSEDGGRSWALVRSLWDQPSRPEWEGGLGGLALHSICPWPGEPDRLAVGISAVGVWITEDGGASWSNHNQGLVPRYLPEDARAGSINHCVHKMERSPVQPETLYMQFHGGVYRSDDGGRSWVDIGSPTGGEGRLPADFGFPLVVDPRDPDRAWVIPLVADVDRVTPEGKIRVYETRNRGASWRALSKGLPQDDAWATILRQAFAHDGRDPLGLVFGTEQGAVYGSADGGATWATLAENLPKVLAVQAS